MTGSAFRNAGFLIAFLAGCSGGSGAEVPQGQVQLDFGSFVAVGGAVLSFAAGEAAFEADATYEGEWRRDGVAPTVATWVTVTSRSVVTLVPVTLPAGSYDVVLALGAKTGHAHVEVTPAPVIADPEGVVQAWVTSVAGTLATQQDEVLNLLPSPTRDGLLADIVSLGQWKASFESSLASASAADLQQLALLLSTGQEHSTSRGSARGAADPGQNWYIAGLHVVIDVPTFSYGITLVAVGLLLPLPPPVKLGLIVAGGLFVVDGVTGVCGTMELPLRPMDRVVMEEGTDSDILSLQAGVPRSLAASARFGTLSEADRGLDFAPAQQVFAALDHGRAQQAGLTPAIRSLFQGEFPPVPLQPTLLRVSIDPARVSIASQSNPNVFATLSDGQLLATLVTAQGQLTTLGLHYDAGAAGYIDTAVACWVFGEGPPSPFEGAWSGAYTGSCNCSPGEGGGIVEGSWSFTVDATGMVRGSAGSQDLVGGVDANGVFTGTAGESRWSGTVVNSIISGSWGDGDPDCPCLGTFVGSGP